MLHHDEVTSEAMKNPMKYAGAWQATEKFSTKVRSWESEPHTRSHQPSMSVSCQWGEGVIFKAPL